MAKPPAFPFYAKDWLADTRELGAVGRGVLIDMIALCWENGSVPDDPTEVACLVGTEIQPLLKVRPSGGTVWQRIRGKFSTDPQNPGRLLNNRLEIERAGQVAYREEQSVKGKRSAAKRAKDAAQQRFNNGSTTVQPDAQPKVNSALCVVRHAGISVEIPPIVPVELFTLGADPVPAKPTRAQRRASDAAMQRAAAVEVLDALNAARTRLSPQTHGLGATDDNLANITARLVAGATVADCLHVIAVRESEVRRDGTQWRWFNPENAFTSKSFTHSLSQETPKATAASPPRRVEPEPEMAWSKPQDAETQRIQREVLAELKRVTSGA